MYRAFRAARTARICVLGRRWNHSKDPLGLSSFVSEIESSGRPQAAEKNDSFSHIAESFSRDQALNESVPNNETSQGSSLDVRDELTELLASLDLSDDVQNDSTQAHPEYSPVNIDASEESDGTNDIFGKALFASEEATSTRDIVKQERDLFEEIFDSYKNIFETPEERNRKVFQKLSGAYGSPRARGGMDRAYEEVVFKKIKQVLQPTIDQIENIESKSQLVETVNTIFDQIKHALEVHSQQDLFLSDLVQHREITEDHQALFDRVEKTSSDDPLRPYMNVFTIPVIFNTFLRMCTFKFRDGQLALTLFNLLKSDLALYTICCNQDTYNEIIRTLWIYQGKSHLYSIDTMYTEMLNNGFEGNLLTFGLTKQILTDYHHLKMGNLELFKSNLPVWTKEDDKKAEKLEGHLRRLSNRIKMAI